MECHVCGTQVRQEQKFCMECGARLHHTQGHELALAPPEARSAVDADTTTRTPALAPAPGAHRMFDPITGQLLAQPSAPARTMPVVDDDATNVLPALGEPQNTYGSGQAFAPPTPHAQGPGHWEREAGEYATPWPTAQPQPGSPVGFDRQTNQPTRQQQVSQPPYRSEAGPHYAEYDRTGVLPQAYAPWEGEWEEEEAPPSYGAKFRIRPLLVLSILPAVAAVVGMFVRIVDIGPDGPLPFGASKLNDFGTNLTVTGILIVVAMLLGALAWCGGYRWGAGLVGGAGAGLAGWVALVVGLAETRIAQAETASAAADPTRDIGYWCLVGAGGLGLIVMLTSLLRAGNDRRAGLDPWVAALGAIATIAAVLGPLIPLNDANLDHNWSSVPGQDLPTLYFVGRFVQLGMLLICGVFGFLLVRRYGLGFAIGGTLGIAWMVLTSATEQTDNPIGPAVLNPGATDLKPYIVTTVGVGLMMFFALVATAMALIDAD